MEEMNSMLDSDLAQMSLEDAYKQYAYFLPEDIEMAIQDDHANNK